MSDRKVASSVAADIKAGMKRGKIVTADEAVRLIRSGDTIALDGLMGGGSPEELIEAMEIRYNETAEPKNLTLLYASGIGDSKDKGLNRLDKEGLLKRVIAGHWGMTPRLQKLAVADKIEAYNLPQGVLSHMFRDIAAGNPRTITSVGIGTFVDPRLEGGKVNSITTEDIVEVVNFDGKEYLAYKTMPVQVAFLRGTTADLDGNITMEKEAMTLEVLPVAMAARNSGGLVIVQVERIADRGALNPRDVKIPGIIVDCVVVSKPENHWQTSGTYYNPAFSCEFKVPAASVAPLEMDERKIIARRAAFELRPNMVVNLGIGMPEGLASVANEEGIFEFLTLTTETGSIGGIPSGGKNFGTSTNMDCMLDMHMQFDFYDGGGLDLACLGLAQMDRHGNVNVSRFGPKLAGCGGFIDISQNSKKMVFAGTFTAGKTKVSVGDGKLNIINEGGLKKFVCDVEQITFSGETARNNNLEVIYITERCVFRLTQEGVELTEIAPGVDLEKDILAYMDFKPIIKNPKLMDERIFMHQPMGLKTDLISKPISERMLYNSADNTFYVDFEGFQVCSVKDIEDISAQVESILAPLGRKVNAIVNYDNFFIIKDLADAYVDMVKSVVSRYYEKVTRYTTSAFIRMKVGEGLKERGIAPHIYESREDARKKLEV
ncbi:acyl CoA:acetate/3-ketoacid CoA transferase [Desulforegula conservatrix]|uniref:acyl CoA:acetate/3-ketoacid CoA transferase n=1 Tax=Desulforegula conservatrix TaxID=153026 RepID=UPI0004040512|nr:acyl CoA:acetate/3-ketoacid CoA transferase [Desulforegula conservatrix]